VATAITAVIGLAVEGCCRKMQPEISARLIPFASGGFRGTYLSGIEEGSMAVMSSFLGATNERSHDAAPSVNIIGPAKEAFNSVSDTAEIRRLLTCMGVGVNMVFPMDCTTQDIVSVPSANLNIVTRDVMLPVGKYIRESCGLEYITGLPMGIRGTMRWVRTVSEKLGIGYPDALVDHEIAAWAFALPELFSRIQTYEHFSAVISAPYEYASGLAGLVAEDWELRVPAVILPEEPKTPDYMDNFKKLGVSDVFINPSDREFSGIIRAASPQIVFGNSYHLKMAQSVPVRIPAASPTPDIITLFDGTPYVGFRGYAYLTQLLVNEAAKHKEVFTQ
jgi:nitrogenase molybdenum-iron protein alpha/beta subunit